MKGSLDYQLAWKILPRLEECKFHPPVIFTVGDFYEPANWLKQDSDVQEINNRVKTLFVSLFSLHGTLTIPQLELSDNQTWNRLTEKTVLVY